MRSLLCLPLALGALNAAGCKTENPLFCCTVTEVCQWPGGTDGEFVQCTDPARPYCDNYGYYGPERSCVPDPIPDGDGGPPDAGDDAASDCTTSADCTTPTAPICSASNLCEACESGATGDADCAAKDAFTPRCASTGACVGCLDSGDCSASEPVCDGATSTCRTCQAHSECGSEICNETSGACVVAGNIVYVATTGVDGAACGTSASPCRNFGGAQGALAKVTATRRWIRMRAGSYSESVAVSATNFALIGDGAELQPGALNEPAILVSNGSDIVIEGVRLHGGGGGADADGLRCAAGGSPSVMLRRVTVDGNSGQGIDASSCAITVERSRILANTGGGISLTSSDFVLVNNFIVKNGGATSQLGGILVNQTPPSGSGGARFDFNTVSGNVANAGLASGVLCGFVTTPLGFSNSIVYGNPGADGQVAGTNCNWTYSDIEGGQAGTGNTNAVPQFVNPTTNDYHIQSGSPCRDAADPAATLGVDVDGQVRPQGARHDMGADEYTP